MSQNQAAQFDPSIQEEGAGSPTPTGTQAAEPFASQAKPSDAPAEGHQSVFSDEAIDPTTPWTTGAENRKMLSADVPYPGEELVPGKVLMVGCEGDEIRWLQGRLNALKVAPPLVIDGVYGAATFNVVARLQRANGYQDTGIVDRQTFDLIG